jgi:predicted transcriptional regulator
VLDFDLELGEMERVRRRRSRVEVIYNILSEALGGANKTRLMYHCNLNFMRFNRYLQELLDAGLIERVGSNLGGVVLYKTSNKGRELVKVLRKASEFVSV